MKRIKSLIIFCVSLAFLVNPAAVITNVAASEVADQEDTGTELNKELKDAYTALKQFVDEQKADGNDAFSMVHVHEDHPEFKDKVVLEYFWGDKETVFSAANTFLLENGIDENLVIFWEAQEAAVEAPQHLYGDFNGDGIVNASDASVILIYAAEYGAGTFTGTFEEYVNR